MNTFYDRISAEFFEKEWSNFYGDWDFRELLRYLSDRRLEISINKGSLWILFPEHLGGTLEILLYHPIKESDEDCKEIYDRFVLCKGKEEETKNEIRAMLSNPNNY